MNEEGIIEEEYHDRESIKQAIAQQNITHFWQAFSSKAYKDKIYNKLKYDQIRDKILRGELEVDEYDDSDIHSFLTLLKRQGVEDQNEMSSKISELEWESVVKKAKKKSASSIFSNRMYSVYKCALEGKVMTKIFVLFYSELIKNGLYLKQWIKVLDVILEKGKGPVLGKLRTIQLIEADLQLLMRIYIGERNKEVIENDQHLSKFNYGSRANYLI